MSTYVKGFHCRRFEQESRPSLFEGLNFRYRNHTFVSIIAVSYLKKAQREAQNKNKHADKSLGVIDIWRGMTVGELARELKNDLGESI